MSKLCCFICFNSDGNIALVKTATYQIPGPQLGILQFMNKRWKRNKCLFIWNVHSNLHLRHIWYNAGNSWASTSWKIEYLIDYWNWIIDILLTFRIFQLQSYILYHWPWATLKCSSNKSIACRSKKYDYSNDFRTKWYFLPGILAPSVYVNLYFGTVAMSARGCKENLES